MDHQTRYAATYTKIIIISFKSFSKTIFQEISGQGAAETKAFVWADESLQRS